MSLIRKHRAVLQAWDCLALVLLVSASASAVDATLYRRRPGVSSGSTSSLEQSTTCDESRQLTAAV